MSDNTTINPGVAGDTIGLDDIGGVKYQRVKLIEGADGTNDGDISSANPLPVQPIAGQVGVQGNTGGVVTALTQRVVLATDVGLPIIAGQVGVQGASGVVTALTQRVVLATDVSLPVLTGITNALPAGTNNIGDVDILTIIPGTSATQLGKAVDAAVGATDTGVAVLAKRTDTLSTITPADGDYARLQVNSQGALHVTGGGGGTQYVGDDVASLTPTGGMVMAVRKDTAAALAGTTGDVTPLQTNSIGALRVSMADSTGAAIEGIEQYDEDAPAAANPTGTMMMMVRDDSWASDVVSTDGDNMAVRGTNYGEIYVRDVTAVTFLQSMVGATVVDDAAFTPASTSVTMVGFEADETATDSVNEGDAGAARMTLDRKIIMTPQPHTQGGTATAAFSSQDGSTALTNSAQAIKASAGQEYGYYIYNPNDEVCFVNFYNTAVGSVTVGTTVPLYHLPIPAGQAANLARTHGVAFSTAMSISATKTAGSATAPDTALDATIWYF